MDRLYSPIAFAEVVVFVVYPVVAVAGEDMLGPIEAVVGCNLVDTALQVAAVEIVGDIVVDFADIVADDLAVEGILVDPGLGPAAESIRMVFDRNLADQDCHSARIANIATVPLVLTQKRILRCF